MKIAPNTSVEVNVTLGVDTHKDNHVAVALDRLGRHLGTLSVPTTTAGYRKLLGWARELGTIEQAGVEGTGSFGAGLTRFLKAEGIQVREVSRPKRRDQYRSGKSDPIDAEAAARAVLAGTGHWRAQGRRRHSRDDPLPACNTPLGGEGPHTGVQPTQGHAPNRPTGATGRVALPLYGQAGPPGLAVSSQR